MVWGYWSKRRMVEWDCLNMLWRRLIKLFFILSCFRYSFAPFSMFTRSILIVQFSVISQLYGVLLHSWKRKINFTMCCDYIIENILFYKPVSLLLSRRLRIYMIKIMEINATNLWCDMLVRLYCPIHLLLCFHVTLKMERKFTAYYLIHQLMIFVKRLKEHFPSGTESYRVLE